MIIEYGGITPRLHSSVFVAEGAQIIGDVEIGKDSTVWFNTVIRGDVHEIRIGERTNIQDLSMLHVTFNKHPLHIGNNVTVGHMAMLHGCTIHDTVLVGMQSTILDRAVINKYAMIAAGAVVLEGMVVPEGTLVAGVPAKVIRDLTETERAKLDQSAQNYVDYVDSYKNGYNIRKNRE